jgi:hypothetical protein
MSGSPARQRIVSQCWCSKLWCWTRARREEQGVANLALQRLQQGERRVAETEQTSMRHFLIQCAIFVRISRGMGKILTC